MNLFASSFIFATDVAILVQYHWQTAFIWWGLSKISNQNALGHTCRSVTQITFLFVCRQFVRNISWETPLMDTHSTDEESTVSQDYWITLNQNLHPVWANNSFTMKWLERSISFRAFCDIRAKTSLHMHNSGITLVPYNSHTRAMCCNTNTNIGQAMQILFFLQLTVKDI